MFGSIGYVELAILAVVAVMLFGKRLPEVARSVGNSYAQFRKGLSDIQHSINIDGLQEDVLEPDLDREYDDYQPPVGARFEPPAESQD